MTPESDRTQEAFSALLNRASGHRRVATVTLAASCFVFLFGVFQTYCWANSVPLSPIKHELLEASMVAALSLRLLVLVAIYYLAISLSLTYRHNIKLSSFFFSRAYSLKLYQAGIEPTLESYAAFLDTTVVTMDAVPAWINPTWPQKT